MSINNSVLVGSKKISSEASLLSPSVLVTFYELDFRNFGINRDDIDLSTLSFKNNLTPPYNNGNGYDSSTTDDPVGILRFHNLNINAENSSSNLVAGSAGLFGQIIWQNKRYIPFPIIVDGIEVASRGTLPKPKLTFTNQIQNSNYNFFFTKIKNTIRSIGDIIGLEITRKRTFLKYLDAVNFKSYGGIINDDNFIVDPDSYAALPDDTFYIDRKLKENKDIIQYELSSIIDLENLKLPLRTMYSEACSLDYRGDGCEYGNNVITNEMLFYKYNSLNNIPEIVEFGYDYFKMKKILNVKNIIDIFNTSGIEYQYCILENILCEINKIHNLEKMKINKNCLLEDIKLEFYDKVYQRINNIEQLLSYFNILSVHNMKIKYKHTYIIDKLYEKIKLYFSKNR